MVPGEVAGDGGPIEINAGRPVAGVLDPQHGDRAPGVDLDRPAVTGDLPGDHGALT